LIDSAILQILFLQCLTLTILISKLQQVLKGLMRINPKKRNKMKEGKKKKNELLTSVVATLISSINLYITYLGTDPIFLSLNNLYISYLAL